MRKLTQALYEIPLKLALVGRFERIGLQWLNNPILMRIQLNDFVVN